MRSKSRNEDKDNIHQDIDVCAMGVQTIMQSDHGTPRNQNNSKSCGWFLYHQCETALELQWKF